MNAQRTGWVKTDQLDKDNISEKGGFKAGMEMEGRIISRARGDQSFQPSQLPAASAERFRSCRRHRITSPLPTMTQETSTGRATLMRTCPPAAQQIAREV